MKKSKLISLVLITAALASCHKKKHHPDWQGGNGRVYMRSDDSAPYDDAGYYNSSYYGYNPWIWYYAFRPYGYYYGNTYYHTGYYSQAISERANIGHSATKTSIVRGGFGKGFSVSS